MLAITSFFGAELEAPLNRSFLFLMIIKSTIKKNNIINILSAVN
jgi:hypothetical protein